MNDNIDLTKILKDCPKGTKFYSSIYGELIYSYTYISSSAAKFVFILPNSNSMFDNTPIKIEYYWNGKYIFNMGECTLFPSKDQKDWYKFTAPWYKKEMGTIDSIEKQDEQTTSQTNEREWLYLVSDVLTWKDGIGQYLDDQRVQELAKKLCSKYSQKLYNPSNIENDEQKSANKIEQKFEVGDWIASNLSNSSNLLCIIGIDETNYEVVTPQGSTGVPSIRYIDKHYHLWTIKDVKDGDVIRLGEVTAIFKKYIGQEKCICYCSFCKNRGFEIPIENGEDNVYGCYNATPATKEQRDLLFQKMKEADYEWNTDNKELKKLVKPKFKVGDKIVNVPKKYMGASGIKGTILKITEDKYIFTDGSYMHIGDQDIWELVIDKKTKFDPKTLKAFDRVLVRDSCNDTWCCGFFSHIAVFDDVYRYCTERTLYEKCIPYNEDTKHLVGTTNEAPEYYRYWED